MCLRILDHVRWVMPIVIQKSFQLKKNLEDAVRVLYNEINVRSLGFYEKTYLKI